MKTETVVDFPQGKENTPLLDKNAGRIARFVPRFLFRLRVADRPLVKVKQRLVRTRVIRAPQQVFVFPLHPSPVLLFRLNGRHFGVNINPLFCLHLESEPQFEKSSPLSNYETASCGIRVKR